MIIARVENVKESIIVCVFETTAGRLVVVMAAAARVVVGVLQSRLFDDLRAHHISSASMINYNIALLPYAIGAE